MIDTASKASIGLLKKIPAGTFHMGSRFHPRELPMRDVFLPEFQITHVPVTVSQYAVFIESAAIPDQRWWSPEGWAWLNAEIDGWGRADRTVPDAWDAQKSHDFYPVVGISAYEADAYCNWLSVQKSKSVRLPTEAEWEYAARGVDWRPFPWGDEFDPLAANTAEKETCGVMDAGSLPGNSSPFGVLDMCGNVQQWTSSPYIPLPAEKFPAATLLVARGSSFNDTVFGSRTSYRRAYPAGYFFPFLGFRMVVGS